MKKVLVVAIFFSAFIIGSMDCFAQLVAVKTSVMPLNILHPTQPYLTGGIEAVFNDKIGLEFNYGQRILSHGVFFSKPYEELVTPNEGKKLQFEFKVYNVIGNNWITNTRHSNYIGLCYTKINDTRNIAITYWFPYSLDNTTSYADVEHTAIKKSIDAINLTMGYLYTINRVSFDGCLMLGAKKKVQDYIDNEYYELGYKSFQHWRWDQPMDAIRFSLNLRVKVSYRIL